MSRKLSAKDKAFEQEKLKLRREIKNLKDKIRYLESELEKEILISNHYEELLDELEKEFKEHYNMSSEEFMQHVQRENRCFESLSMIHSLMGGVTSTR